MEKTEKPAGVEEKSESMEEKPAGMEEKSDGRTGQSAGKGKPPAGAMRLDRFLAEMGAGTRGQIRDAAKNGRIQVNGVVEKRPERKLFPEEDTVTFDGRRVAYAAFEYYMLNKPQGVVSATEDNRYQTVVELIGERKRGDLFPVGRLDIDTEGLLLITNDGALAHRLLSPKKHVDKRYLAVVEGRLPDDAAEQFAAGIVLADGTVTMPARLEAADAFPCGKVASGTFSVLPDGGESRQVIVTIREGKFHQVKRMFETLGCRVTYLKRLSMGSLVLDESLRPGQYRPLTDEELAAFEVV